MFNYDPNCPPYKAARSFERKQDMPKVVLARTRILT
jgi:hypothetical protein